MSHLKRCQGTTIGYTAIKLRRPVLALVVLFRVDTIGRHCVALRNCEKCSGFFWIELRRTPVLERCLCQGNRVLAELPGCAFDCGQRADIFLWIVRGT